MNALRLRLPRIGALLGGTCLLWACNAPILNVPPPSQISFTSAVLTDATGAAQTVWITQGGPFAQAANAAYFVLDLRLGSGVIATAKDDGSFVAPEMQGNAGDSVDISYDTPSADKSPAACFQLSTDIPPPACP